MAVNWLIFLTMTGLVLITVFIAAMTGFYASRRDARSGNRRYFWDDP